MSVLSREEFKKHLFGLQQHDAGGGWSTALQHDEAQRQLIAELEADQKRIVATIDGMARLLGGEAPDLPRLVDEVIATRAASLKELDEARAKLESLDRLTQNEIKALNAELAALRLRVQEAGTLLGLCGSHDSLVSTAWAILCPEQAEKNKAEALKWVETHPAIDDAMASEEGK